MKEKITVLGTRLWTRLANVKKTKKQKQEQEIRLKNGIVLFKKTLPEYKHKFKSN